MKTVFAILIILAILFFAVGKSSTGNDAINVIEGRRMAAW